MFAWKNSNNLKYLEIEGFKEKGVRAIFTSSQGGVSSGSFASLNLGFHTEDAKENIIENRKILASTLGINYENFTAAEQVHKDRVYVVEGDDMGKGALSYDSSIPETDALITDRADIPLISFYADCVPLYFFDPVNGVVGLAHAGWKGTLARIGVNTIRTMTENFGSCPADCLAAIGPCISVDNYEVDNYVFDKFRVEFPFWKEITVIHSNDLYQLDLKLCNKILLTEAGIPEKQITVSHYCTYANPSNFYSYRRDKGHTGRMASLIVR